MAKNNIHISNKNSFRQDRQEESKEQAVEQPVQEPDSSTLNKDSVGIWTEEKIGAVELQKEFEEANTAAETTDREFFNQWVKEEITADEALALTEEFLESQAAVVVEEFAKPESYVDVAMMQNIAEMGLADYEKNMRPGTPIEEERGVFNNIHFVKGIVAVIETLDTYYVSPVMDAVIKFFKDYREGVCHPRYLNRFESSAKWRSADKELFTAVIQLFLQLSSDDYVKGTISEQSIDELKLSTRLTAAFKLCI